MLQKIGLKQNVKGRKQRTKKRKKKERERVLRKGG
jgi:hypothetical protein